MKLAFLSPFTTNELFKYFPEIRNNNVPNGMGGSAVFELVHGLIEFGIDLYLVTLDPTANKIYDLHSNNIHYFILPRRGGKALRDFYKKERKVIVNILKKINPDIVHANWTYEYALAALDYDVNKTIVTAHDIPLKVLRYSSLYYFPLFLMSYYVYRISKALVFVSNSVKKFAEPVLRNNQIVKIIPNIVDLSDIDLSRIKTISLPENYFISIGLWNKLKNLKYSINAFNLFVKSNPNYFYVLIGPGLDNKGECYKYLLRNKLLDNVILLGKLSRPETLKYLSEAKALIHPSYTEACPMVIGEAMKLGVPVIVGKNSDGAEELVNYGEYGFVINLNNITELIKKLEEIKNQSNVKYIVNKAKRYILNNFNKDILLEKYINIYKLI